MNHPSDVRWRQRLQSFRRAFGQLAAGVDLAKERPLTQLEQQGLIQSFEFTHELAWNTLKDYLRFQGIEGITGSRGATRRAFQEGLLEDGEAWMEMITSRNQTSHTYNQETAAEITEAILKVYRRAFEQLLKRFATLEAEASS